MGNDTHSLSKYNKIQITDPTTIKFGNTGANLLQKWDKKYNDKINYGIIHLFVRSTKTNSPTSHSAATTLPPFGVSFMYIATSSNIHGNNVFVSFERTDIIQISAIAFYYNRYSL